MSPLVLVPEALVTAAAVGLWLAGRWRVPAPRLRLAAMALALIAFALELWLGAAVGSLFGGGWAQDRFALFAKAALLFTTFVVLLAEERWTQPALGLPLVFAVCLGGMVAASATTLLGLWLGLGAAVAAAVAAGALGSPEAGGRSWPLALLVGVMVTLGFALTVGLTHAFTLDGLQALAPGQVSVPLAIVVLVALAGIALAAGLAPLQAARVEGPVEGVTPAAAATGGLLLGVAAVVGVQFLAWLWPAAAAWGLWLGVVGVFAMLVGGLRALAAPTPRLAAAWLVVGQLGWLAEGLAVNDRAGTSAVLFGLGGLLLAAGAAPAMAARVGEGVRGLAVTRPAQAVGLGLVLLALAAVPPLAGFYGQFMVAAALVRGGLIWALAAGLLGWLCALAAVVRLLWRLFLEAAEEAPRPRSRRARGQEWEAAPLLVGGLLLAYGLFAYPIQVLAVQAAAALRLP